MKNRGIIFRPVIRPQNQGNKQLAWTTISSRQQAINVDRRTDRRRLINLVHLAYAGFVALTSTWLMHAVIVSKKAKQAISLMLTPAANRLVFLRANNLTAHRSTCRLSRKRRHRAMRWHLIIHLSPLIVHLQHAACVSTSILACGVSTELNTVDTSHDKPTQQDFKKSINPDFCPLQYVDIEIQGVVNPVSTLVDSGSEICLASMTLFEPPHVSW